MNTEQTTIGIIGLGNIGLLHAERFSTLGTNIAGMDSNDDARRRFVEQHGAPVFHTTHDLFDAVDAVVIAVPNKYHDQYAIAALEAGLDVFLEKPMADTWGNAKQITDAAENADGACMIGFHNRYHAVVEQFKQLQARGFFGELTHIEANYVRRSGVPEHGNWFTDQRIAGGGALIDIGVHAIDLALYLLGAPSVEDVVGTTRRAPEHEFNVEDAASAFIRCTGNKTISLEVAWQTQGPENKAFVIHGSKGGAKLIPGDKQLKLFDADSQTNLEVESIDPYKQQAQSFLNAIKHGVAPERNTADEALAVQCVIDSVYRSSGVLEQTDDAAVANSETCIQPDLAK